LINKVVYNGFEWKDCSNNIKTQLPRHVTPTTEGPNRMIPSASTYSYVSPIHHSHKPYQRYPAWFLT